MLKIGAVRKEAKEQKIPAATKRESVLGRSRSGASVAADGLLETTRGLGDGAQIGEEDGMTFNLVGENWIPVLYADGRAERVGIRKVLTDARSIRQISASNPME